MNYWTQLLIACPLVFLAGFVDAIAGGGGLISLPAYYFIGLPPHLALGTNKLSSSVGTAASTFEYIKGGHYYKPILLGSVLAALVGSAIGAQCVLFLDEAVLRYIMLILLPAIAIFTMVKKDLMEPKEPLDSKVKEQVITIIMALAIGWYDGFFGPGTGTFLILGFIGLVRLDPIKACGNTKVVNLCSNIAAVAMFIVGGTIVYRIALPCAAFSILGHATGAKLNIKNGTKLIRPVLLIVMTLLLLTIAKDVFQAALA